MSQRDRRDGGWVSVELAIITPVLLFLVSVFVTLLGISTQRVNFMATLRDCAIAAARLEPAQSLTSQARDSLPGLQDVVVDVVGSSRDLRVTLHGRMPLPAPLQAIDLDWSESLVVAGDS